MGIWRRGSMPGWPSSMHLILLYHTKKTQILYMHYTENKQLYCKNAIQLFTKIACNFSREIVAKQNTKVYSDKVFFYKFLLLDKVVDIDRSSAFPISNCINDPIHRKVLRRWPREDWIIYRGPGFLKVVLFDSTPISLPSASCLAFSAFLCVAGPAYWRGRRGWQGAKSYDRNKAWPSV